MWYIIMYKHTLSTVVLQVWTVNGMPKYLLTKQWLCGYYNCCEHVLGYVCICSYSPGSGFVIKHSISHCSDQVLTGMLLHVIKSSSPVHGHVNVFSLSHRSSCKVYSHCSISHNSQHFNIVNLKTSTSVYTVGPQLSESTLSESLVILQTLFQILKSQKTTWFSSKSSNK